MPRPNPILTFPIVDPTLIHAAIETIRLADSIDLASFPCEAGPDRDDCAIHDNELLDVHRGRIADAAVDAAFFLAHTWAQTWAQILRVERFAQLNRVAAQSANHEPESETPCP